MKTIELLCPHISWQLCKVCIFNGTIHYTKLSQKLDTDVKRINHHHVFSPWSELASLIWLIWQTLQRIKRKLTTQEEEELRSRQNTNLYLLARNVTDEVGNKRYSYKWLVSESQSSGTFCWLGTTETTSSSSRNSAWRKKKTSIQSRRSESSLHSSNRFVAVVELTKSSRFCTVMVRERLCKNHLIRAFRDTRKSHVIKTYTSSASKSSMLIFLHSETKKNFCKLCARDRRKTEQEGTAIVEKRREIAVVGLHACTNPRLYSTSLWNFIAYNRPSGLWCRWCIAVEYFSSYSQSVRPSSLCRTVETQAANAQRAKWLRITYSRLRTQVGQRQPSVTEAGAIKRVYLNAACICVLQELTARVSSWLRPRTPPRRQVVN
jgi:hypothetical protein